MRKQCITVATVSCRRKHRVDDCLLRCSPGAQEGSSSPPQRLRGPQPVRVGVLSSSKLRKHGEGKRWEGPSAPDRCRASSVRKNVDYKGPATEKPKLRLLPNQEPITRSRPCRKRSSSGKFQARRLGVVGQLLERTRRRREGVLTDAARRVGAGRDPRSAVSAWAGPSSLSAVVHVRNNADAGASVVGRGESEGGVAVYDGDESAPCRGCRKIETHGGCRTSRILHHQAGSGRMHSTQCRARRRCRGSPSCR